MRTLLCALLVASLSAQVVLKQSSEKISVTIDGKPFTELLFGPDTRKPYLYPLLSASGKSVVRSVPATSAEPGKPADHPHHQGLSFTFADVNGYNFWASDPSQLDGKSGRISLRHVVSVKGATTQLVFEWLDPGGKAILQERRTMTFSGTPTERIVDFHVALTALTQVKFGDTKEGMFNIRLGSEFNEPNGVMVSSSGCRTEKECWGKRAEWMDFTGEIGGEKLGVAIFDHPGNPRHPTYWHARGYGLFAANPFGIRDFSGDKTADGSLLLQSGETLQFRYRLLIHAANAPLAEAYRQWSVK